MLKKSLAASLVGLALSTPLVAHGQNTGGVFGPVVNEGHRSAQYRIAYDQNSRADAQRLHFQQSINDDFMWRVVAQQREVPRGSHEHDFVQFEMFWQLPDVRSNWKQGLRFDLNIKDDNRPNGFGLHWMNDLELSDSTTLRFLVLSSVQFGDNRASGVFVQTRGHVNYRYSSNLNVAVSLFNNYGRLDDMPGFDQQRHQIGPTANYSFGRGWQAQAGYLAGLTDSTPDHTFRLWITKSF